MIELVSMHAKYVSSTDAKLFSASVTKAASLLEDKGTVKCRVWREASPPLSSQGKSETCCALHSSLKDYCNILRPSRVLSKHDITGMEIEQDISFFFFMAEDES